MTELSVVILTMGTRPQELQAAIDAVKNQGTASEIVLVINGGDPDRSQADVVVDPGHNLGIPAGRNAGAAAAHGLILAFLDDDGLLIGSVLNAAVAAFTTNPRLGALALRIVDDEGTTARRHLSGLRKRPNQSGPVTSFPGGAVLIRRDAFDEVGGLCSDFFYGLEETDLAWRLLNAGWDLRYQADLRFRHPRTVPSRHADFVYQTARNRVWLVHRNLPLALGVLYVTNWTLITVLRNLLNPSALRHHVRGTLAGLRHPVGPRQPLRWATIGELCRRGRPPVI